MNKETQRDTLVRLINSENGSFIQGYWTSDGAEALKMFDYVMRHGIEVEINNEDEYKEGVIDDIRINFGDDTHLTSVNIYATIV